MARFKIEIPIHPEANRDDIFDIIQHDIDSPDVNVVEQDVEGDKVLLTVDMSVAGWSEDDVLHEVTRSLDEPFDLYHATCDLDLDYEHKKREVSAEPILSWSDYEATKHIERWLREQWEDEKAHADEDDERHHFTDDDWFEYACKDHDALQYEWDWTVEALTDLMDAIDQSSYWFATVENFGWRSLNGFKAFKAEDGTDLLREVLPDTDCSFRIYKWGDDGFAIDNAHHDKPFGGEWYHIFPI